MEKVKKYEKFPHVIKTIFSIAWGNPYTSPPEGERRELIRIEIDGHTTKEPDEIKNYKRRSGYSQHINWETKPPKRWSKETKKKALFKRKSTIIKKKYPLFAKEFIEELKNET